MQLKSYLLNNSSLARGQANILALSRLISGTINDENDLNNSRKLQ